MSDVEPVSYANDNGAPPWDAVVSPVSDSADNGQPPGNQPIELSADVDGLDVSLSWSPSFVDGCEVDWHDGTDVVYGVDSATHSYSVPGTYAISVDPFGDENPRVTTSVELS